MSTPIDNSGDARITQADTGGPLPALPGSPSAPVATRPPEANETARHRRRERAGRRLAQYHAGRRRVACARCGAVYWWDPEGIQGLEDLCRGCREGHYICRCCGAVERKPGRGFLCSDECRNEEAARRWWSEAVPPLYQSTDTLRLPSADATLRLLRWEPTPSHPGAFVTGASGAGKTRSAYLLLRGRRAAGYSVAYLMGSEFQIEVGERLRPGGTGGFAEWIGRLHSVGVLVVDEAEKLGLASASSRTVAELFRLVERRVSAGLQTVMLSNLLPGEVASRIKDPAYSEPIARRLREHFALFEFGAGCGPAAGPTARRPAPPAPSTLPDDPGAL